MIGQHGSASFQPDLGTVAIFTKSHANHIRSHPSRQILQDSVAPYADVLCRSQVLHDWLISLRVIALFTKSCCSCMQPGSA
jgi:hypothetical protein